MKTCCFCRCEKPATTEFFPVARARKDGLQPRCKACFKAYRAAHRARVNAKVKALTEANKERYLQKKVAWRETHRAEAAKRSRDWHADKGHTAEVRTRRSAYAKMWRTTQAHKNVAKSEKYRAAQLQRIPVWASIEDMWVFEEAAALARLREQLVGGKWHVDHIYPLQGALVSGLHVMDNLQVVPATFNASKLNRYNPTVGPMRFLG